jgi:hypothetical protein
MGEYLEKIYAVFEKNIYKGKGTFEIQKIINDNEGKKEWFIKLDHLRNFFIHKATPYIAVDVTNRESYNLLIMKKNLYKFDNPNDYFTLKDLNQTVRGFSQSKKIIQEHVIQIIKNRK